MNQYKKLLSAALFTFSMNIAIADELAEIMFNVCEKTKSCAIAQIAEVEMDEETKAMMMPMFEGMCDALQTQYSPYVDQHDLYDPAIQCFTSMEAMSCEELMAGGDNKTDECKNLEDLAQQ